MDPSKSEISYSANITVIQRRGSVPCDSLAALGLGGRNGCNGKNRNRKKILRRRSSGGAEILSPIIGESSEPSGSGGGDENVANSGGSTWYRFKRDITRNRSDLDSLLSRRRGSLPVEVLAVSHSGNFKYFRIFFLHIFQSF